MDNQSTKVVGCRLPMGEYIRILQKAMESKTTVADFIIAKLYTEDKVPQLSNQIQQRDTEIGQLRKQLADVQGKVASKEKEINQLTITLSQVKSDAYKSTQETSQVLNQVKGTVAQIEVLRRSEAIAAGQITQLEKEVANQVKENAQLKRENEELKGRVSAMKSRANDMYVQLDRVHRKAFLGAVDKEAWVILEGLKKL